jgi:hypothetical protein
MVTSVSPCVGVVFMVVGVVLAVMADGFKQGLTLAHFVAQPQPFWLVSRFVFSS